MYQLLTDIHTLLPMTGKREQPSPVINHAAILIKDNSIEWLGTTSEVVQVLRDKQINVVEHISLKNHIVLPGLVNTHHHLYQTLTRCMAQDAGLFKWLKTLYPIWLGLTSEAIYTSAKTGLAELLLSGCTTSSDHLYMYPNDCTLEDTIRAAQELGIRFHAARGSLSLGESRGGLPPDKATENEADILKDSVRVIERFHDAARYAMVRVALAPCSPFSVTPDLMLESARLARYYGVMLHTHLAETRDEDAFCLARFGKRPLDYAESLEWTGQDVWFAHGVHFGQQDLTRMAACGCGVAHCPSSNMRLASGIAPIRLMLGAGVKVGLGVDGSASNDGNHLLAEVRQALLLQRVMDESFALLGSEAQPTSPAQTSPVQTSPALSAYEALWLATRGGAEVLGRDDIGQLSPGYAADLIAINLNRIDYAGALHDPVAALLFCAPRGVDFSMINGTAVVKEGQIVGLELPELVERHNKLSLELINR
jgi:8-oxoguanine deaminase